MEHGIQIAAMAIILTILISYFQYKRISLMSTRMFTAFLLLALFNILSEFLTLYTLGNVDTVNPAVNRFCHQLFIGSLDAIALFMFIYIDMKARKQKRYSPLELIVRCLPAFAVLIMVLFGKLEYHIGTDGRYSYGTMAMTVYASVAVYMAMILLRLKKSGECFLKKEKRNLLYGIAVWIGIALFQYFHPVMLLSSLGVSLMAAFVYISFENPREYQERELPELMNRYALGTALTELLQKKRTFYIVSMMLLNGEMLRSIYGYSTFFAMLQEKAEHIIGNEGNRFCFNESIISTVFTKKEAYQSWRQSWKEKEEIAETQGGGPQFQFFVMECPRYAADLDTIFSLLEFCSRETGKWNPEEIMEADESCVERMNYQEKVEEILRKALREDGLEVYYQPIYSVEKQGFVSAEALVRLKDCETVGFVSPEIFIPMAENKGMIRELGNIVFEKVCRFAAENDLNGQGVEYIEVNLSGIQSTDQNLPETLLKIAGRYGINPDFINLEITETAAVQAGERLTSNMKELRRAGCHFSMDDFGTGYSNLSYIGKSNFELIKLDKSLLWPCFEKDGKKAEIVLKACIDLMHHLECEIVAEGVETQEQAEMLMEYGVEYLQGYYYAKPMPQAAYINFLKMEKTT